MDHVRTLKVPTSDLYLLPRWRPTPLDRMVFVVRDRNRVATVQYSTGTRKRRILSINNLRDPCYARLNVFALCAFPLYHSLLSELRSQLRCEDQPQESFPSFLPIPWNASGGWEGRAKFAPTSCNSKQAGLYGVSQ